MAGNVSEWTADWYGPYASGRQVNPAGPASGESRVVRGGSYHDNKRYLRSAFRDTLGPGHFSDLIGFRCVVAGAAGE